MVDLASKQLNAVRRLGAARNVDLIADLLARRVSGLQVITDYFDDPRAAGWAGGTVHVNLNRADASSPLHELSEVWGAVYEQQEPEAYQQTLDMLRGSQAHEVTPKAYPDLGDRGPLREALHLEVQQAAALPSAVPRRRARLAGSGASWKSRRTGWERNSLRSGWPGCKASAS